ncbi:ectonucleotide pyrophosphatase/phosphodiesterase [soil metagenome]
MISDHKQSGFLRLISLLILVAGTVLGLSSCRSDSERPYVIMVSFDGLSQEQLERFNPPNFGKIKSKGVIAESLVSSFPSKTFPNHYTIVTGLYPGNHGLVDNRFYDAPRNTIYTMGDRGLVEDPYYYGGTPLWQLVKEHGLKTASYFWVGSEVAVKGIFPDHYFPYDQKTPNDVRIDKVKEWLSLPDGERPHFITLYFSLVDSEGHKSGPFSETTKAAVLEADRLLGKLMEQLESIGLPFNLIITSDHGMYEFKNNPDQFVYLDQIMPALDSEIKLINNATLSHIYFHKKASIQPFYEKIQQDTSRYFVVKKEESPEIWQYKNSERIGDILIVAKPGILIRDEWKVNRDNNPRITGVHGYDPYTTPEMGGIFLAYGNNIVKGKVISSFENVHIYPFIARILNLEIPPVDGNADVLDPILIK